MTTQNGFSDRRRELRQDSDDVIRWKRPGKLEDQRAWSIDLSSSGMGFMTPHDAAPSVGDMLHLHRQIGNTWEKIERPVRVARVSSSSNPEVVTVGCELGATPAPSPVEKPEAYTISYPW